MACSSTAHGTVAIGGGGSANLTDKTIVHSGSGATRTAGLVINNDGTVNWRRTFTFVQLNPLSDWLVPNEAGGAYDVRITNLSWTTMDEGWLVSPSGTISSDHTTLTFSGSTITRTGGTSFITQGFTAGSIIRIDRTNLNEGNYTIATGGVASSVITVDESFTAEGPIVCNLTERGTGDAATGDEDTWYSLDVPREWTFIDTGGSGIGVGVQHATFDMQIRRGGTVLTTAAMDWFVDSGAGGGGGGGGGCFAYGTLMRMEDGSLKEIQDIVPGDQMAQGGNVYQQQIGDASEETWYDVNGVTVTGTHTMCKDGIWMHVEDAGYPEADCDDQVYYIVSNHNHQMVTENGQLFTDYSEVEYQSSGWDDWVLLKLNGKADNDTMKKAIESTHKED